MKNCWSSRLNKFRFGQATGLLILVLTVAAKAQLSPPDEKVSVAERYLYPIRPGQPGSLAGTMGELRTTHFHSGIDIRTDNRIGLPVLASRSGYISRVTVTPSGYGNVLYITHPDGYSTLYAHLDRFTGAIARYVLQEQYRQKSGSVDLYPQPNQFKVSRGDTVALSGNTGSSGGPHLHFDIRDPENFALNPLKIEGFSEVVDELPPAVEKVALKTLDIHSRINDKFGRFEFYAQRVGNDFVFTAPILAYGNIGIEVLAKDRLAPKSQFWGGVNHIEMAVNDVTVFKQDIEKINIAETRGIYTLMDFKTMRLNGNRFYKLYIDDGNELNFYSQSPSSGRVKVIDKEADIKVVLRDSYGNASSLSLKLQPSKPTTEVKMLEPLKSSVEYDVYENTLTIATPPCVEDSNSAVIYSRGKTSLIHPQYYNVNRSVYLIDLRKTLPDSISVCGKSIVTNIKAVVPPSMEFNYYSDYADIHFPEKSLYDTVYLTTYKGLSSDSTEIFNIGSRVHPLNNAINVTIRPTVKYEWNPQYAVYRIAGRNGYAYLGGGWQNGGVHFATREFGDFTILKDNVAPKITPVVINNTIVKFKIRDNLSGINKYEANINGEWLLMHYDPKTATIWSERLNKMKPLKGTLKLVVTDNSGNEATFTKQIP